MSTQHKEIHRVINALKEMISFEDAVKLSAVSERSVLLLRHSYRESLVNGNHDPGLTAAGYEYAVECGKFLHGMKNLYFGASLRKRTLETIQAIRQGAGFGTSEIGRYPQIHDSAMFLTPEHLGEAIEDGTVPALLKSYFSTGSAPGMLDIGAFAPSLLAFLTGDFPCPNVILSTHDIIIVALLSFYKAWNFTPDDWCGYVQGAFLYRQDGIWNISYCVPDKNDRKLTQLFV